MDTWCSGCGDALLDDDLLAGGTDVGVRARGSGGPQGSGGSGAGQPVCCDVFLVGLPDDFESTDVGVGDVSDGVTVNSWFVGDGADLPHWQPWWFRFGEEALEGFVIAEGDESAGALPGRSWSWG